MKKCSYCGRENEPQARLCAGCGEELHGIRGDQAPVPDPADPGPVTVASFHSQDQAQLLKAELEAMGIPAEVPEEYGAVIFSGVIPLQAATVQVAASDAAAARAVAEAFLANQKPAEPAEPEQPEPPAVANPANQTRCVACGERIPLDSVLCPKCGWTQPRLA